ncbi:MAG: YibE/F family protein [Candidatus Magasanikbacteria bacterium]|nr:YibE/F family protein [Candidatus Magasanikbacteria bacterium]
MRKSGHKNEQPPTKEEIKSNYNFVYRPFLLALVSLVVLVVPKTVSAAENFTPTEKSFLAKVMAVVGEQKKIDGNGKEYAVQALKLKGLEGEWKDKEINYNSQNLSADIIGLPAFKVGDKVVVNRNVDKEDRETFYITDYARTGRLYFLLALFFGLVILIGKKQGGKAIIGLVFTFFVLMKFIIPQILDGANPIMISIIGSFVILVVSLYLVHGFNAKTSVALAGTFLSLAFTGILSFVFVQFTRLTGFGDESAAFLVNTGQNVLNIKGILLAGMIIGALGVLDDITISQASVVEQIYRANANLSPREIYQRAMKVGVDHVSSIVNTLVLAYAGASLPVLLLFSLDSSLSLSTAQIINNEIIATEIVRTIVGSMGLVVAVPLTSLIAAYFLKNKILRLDSGAAEHIH